VAAKIISDFRRDHATSPCLSTTLGNRKLPDDERWPSDCGVVPFVAMPRVRVARGGLVVYQPVQTPASAVRAERLQGRENQADNFFTFVTQATHGINPDRRDRA
jgi:hypothetical protein